MFWALTLSLETTRSQTYYVVAMTALIAVAEVTNGDDGAMSQTNGVVVTMMALVGEAVTCGDDGVMSRTSCVVVMNAPAAVVANCGDGGAPP